LPTNEPYITAPLKELQLRVARDDENAFTQLYLHFGKKLILFGVSLVRSREIAEELVEDVFVKLWANRQHIVEIENITVYLYVAVKNKALNKLSQKASELIAAPFDFLDTRLDEFAASPYDLLITSEMMGRMHEVIRLCLPAVK
jgi:RNA polymerase sigma-70 factor (ECF subfamily)